MAKNTGIKYYTKYSKDELAKIFGIYVSNDRISIPVQIVNLDTGDINESTNVVKQWVKNKDH